MKKVANPKSIDELRPEYDLSRLGPGTRGKYHARAMAGSNVVRIDPDLAAMFPDAESVNRALRSIALPKERVGPGR